MSHKFNVLIRPNQEHFVAENLVQNQNPEPQADEKTVTPLSEGSGSGKLVIKQVYFTLAELGMK